ncbi:MAG: hypothetical protein LAP61_22945 [Acidobacteriia bacterium]|nr:hypothetical protein [Terriglobia bacterium]
MAIDQATVWETRPAAGSDNNGGAFIAGASGTDYSQQDSAQIAYTDLVIDASDAKKLTSSGHPFTSAHVGNTIKITGGTGFTTGRYQVLSVAAGVATMDRNVGTTSSTGGTGNLGGALATLAAAWTDGVTSNTYWLKGTLTVTSALTMARAVTSSDAGPNKIIGYGTVRGDGTRASWTTSSNSVDLIQFTQAKGYYFQNIEFSSSAGTPGFGLNAKTSNNSTGIVLDNCLLHGFNKAIRGDFSGDFGFVSIVLYRCRVYSCTSHGIHNDGGTFLLASYVHDNGGDGILQGNQSSMKPGVILVWRSVIKSNAGKGVNCQMQADEANGARFPIVIESDLLNNGGDNLYVQGNPTGIIAINSIIDSAGGYGINNLLSYFMFQVLGSIAWRANTTADTNNVPKSPSDVTLTGDPFTARGSDDFTLNSTAGAGAACRAIGQPVVFPP